MRFSRSTACARYGTSGNAFGPHADRQALSLALVTTREQPARRRGTRHSNRAGAIASRWYAERCGRSVYHHPSRKEDSDINQF